MRVAGLFVAVGVIRAIVLFRRDRRAKEFLIGELGAGTKMVKDVRNKARTVGIKPELLDSARRELGVEQYRDFNGDIKWRLGEGP